MKKIIWKISFSIITPKVIAIIAKTTDAAPLNPTHEINNFSFIVNLKGLRMVNVANGRATNIINNEIATAFPLTYGNLDGKDNKPNIKNNAICIIQEIPSKK